jgi:thioredoxin 1
MNTTVFIAISVVIVAFFYIAYSFRQMKNAPMISDNEKIKTLTNQNFQNQIQQGVTLVDFWAEWCMPCKMMIPILNNVADELEENTSVGKLNIEDNQDIAAKYQVRSIPTMILFKNGNEIKRFVGVKQKDFLVNEINKASN